jgi:hypothetical protein
VKRPEFPEASLPDRRGRDRGANGREGNGALAKPIPAAAIEPVQAPVDHFDNRLERRPDTAVLYRMRAAAVPFAVTVFATPLNVEIGPDQEWHWAIVQAKGYPPQQHSEQAARGGIATGVTPEPPGMGIVQPVALTPRDASNPGTLPPDNPSRGASTRPSSGSYNSGVSNLGASSSDASNR